MSRLGKNDLPETAFLCLSLLLFFHVAQTMVCYYKLDINVLTPIHRKLGPQYNSDETFRIGVAHEG